MEPVRSVRRHGNARGAAALERLLVDHRCDPEPGAVVGDLRARLLQHELCGDARQPGRHAELRHPGRRDDRDPAPDRPDELRLPPRPVELGRRRHASPDAPAGGRDDLLQRPGEHGARCTEPEHRGAGAGRPAGDVGHCADAVPGPVDSVVPDRRDAGAEQPPAGHLVPDVRLRHAVGRLARPGRKRAHRGRQSARLDLLRPVAGRRADGPRRRLRRWRRRGRSDRPAGDPGPRGGPCVRTRARARRRCSEPRSVVSGLRAVRPGEHASGLDRRVRPERQQRQHRVAGDVPRLHVVRRAGVDLAVPLRSAAGKRPAQPDDRRDRPPVVEGSRLGGDRKWPPIPEPDPPFDLELELPVFPLHDSRTSSP